MAERDRGEARPGNECNARDKAIAGQTEVVSASSEEWVEECDLSPPPSPPRAEHGGTAKETSGHKLALPPPFLPSLPRPACMVAQASPTAPICVHSDTCLREAREHGSSPQQDK